MWRNLFYSGFHTPKAVTYHEPAVMWLFTIGHSLGRVEACFGPSTYRTVKVLGSKYISNPDFACKPFNFKSLHRAPFFQKKSEAMFEISD